MVKYFHYAIRFPLSVIPRENKSYYLCESYKFTMYIIKLTLHEIRFLRPIGGCVKNPKL